MEYHLQAIDELSIPNDSDAEEGDHVDAIQPVTSKYCKIFHFPQHWLVNTSHIMLVFEIISFANLCAVLMLVVHELCGNLSYFGHIQKLPLSWGNLKIAVYEDIKTP